LAIVSTRLNDFLNMDSLRLTINNLNAGHSPATVYYQNNSGALAVMALNYHIFLTII
jgi:hypothetical protein